MELFPKEGMSDIAKYEEIVGDLLLGERELLLCLLVGSEENTRE